jgi:hypothetical protein
MGGGFIGKLRRKCQFPRHVALRNRALLDAEHRLAGFTIENVHVARLRGDGECGNRGPATHDIEQRWRRGRVVIPEIVMNGLKVPPVFFQ